MPSPATTPREWVVLQRSLPDLFDDSPQALISVALDVETGQICGMDLGDDSGESLAQALQERAPGTEWIPDPDSILAPTDLLPLVRLQTGRFETPPSVGILPADLAQQADLAIDALLAMLRGAAPLGDVLPEDWQQLVTEAWAFRQRQCWDVLGETPLRLRMKSAGGAATWIAVASGEMGTSYGLVLFPSAAEYRAFLSTDDDEDQGDFPAGTIVFSLSADAELEVMRAVAVSMGWPENEASLPLVMRCRGGGERDWESADVRIATVALRAVVDFVTSNAGTVKTRHALSDGEMVVCDTSMLPERGSLSGPSSPQGGRPRRSDR